MIDNIAKILIVIIIIIVVCSCLNVGGIDNFNSIGRIHVPTDAYLRKPVDPYQINHVYNPQYNWPKYIGKYPYYNFFFNPYSTSVYY